MTDLSKANLESLLKELSVLGEDQAELDLWANIYDALNEQEKTELIENLEKEVKGLKELGD